jgi:hypothetical protein
MPAATCADGTGSCDGEDAFAGVLPPADGGDELTPTLIAGVDVDGDEAADITADFVSIDGGLPAPTGGGSRLLFWAVVLSFGAVAVWLVLWYIDRGKRRRPAPLADPNAQAVDLTECFKTQSGELSSTGSRSDGGGGGGGSGGVDGVAATGVPSAKGILFPSAAFLKAVRQRSEQQQVGVVAYPAVRRPRCTSLIVPACPSSRFTSFHALFADRAARAAAFPAHLGSRERLFRHSVGQRVRSRARQDSSVCVEPRVCGSVVVRLRREAMC